MEGLYRYFIITSISITILFIVYSLIIKKETNFKLIRIYLVSSLVFAVLLPFNQVGFDLPNIFESEQGKINDTEKLTTAANQDINQSPTNLNAQSYIKAEELAENSINLKQTALIIYLIISSVFMGRILFSVLQIAWYYLISEKKKHQGFTIITLTKSSIPFSFFKLIFINKSVSNESIKQIILHEKIHAKQFHTIDLLFTELLVAAMWFNPFIWMYKKALQQVHEFLADEGVLNSGVDQLEYQSILVNQAAEGSLVAVSSNFSYSLIKKRIMMMSQKKTHGFWKHKLLVLLPVLFILTFGVSCINGQEKGNNELVAAVSPTKMNVLYLGVDNPVSIAVTDTNKGKIKASIDNGTIIGENGKYIVRVKKKGIATISVKADNKVVAKTMFRVKRVPDPIAVVKGNWNKHEFSIEELIKADGIQVLLVNFDFDLKFEVVSFSISATNAEGSNQDAKQNNGNSFTKEQIKIINQVPIGRKIYIEDIKAKGPDGAIRNLSPIVIRIK